MKLKFCIHNLHKSLEIPIANLKLAKHVTLLIIFNQSLYYQLVTDHLTLDNLVSLCETPSIQYQIQVYRTYAKNKCNTFHFQHTEEV